MSIEIIIILLSLSSPFLINAELPKNNENSINQRFENMEKEILRLKTDNRYLRSKLEKVEQKLEEEIVNLKRKNDTVGFEEFLAETTQFTTTVKDDFKASFVSCLLQKLGFDQNDFKTVKETSLNKKKVLNETSYDEHFICLENCEVTDGIPTSCRDALAANRTGDGVYQLYIPNSSLKPFYVYCLQDAYGDNAWLIIQRRQQGNSNFVRNWTDYLQGFGDLNGDYWLGLERLHALTTSRKYELWIQMKDNAGVARYASYSEFAIANEAENFKLTRLGEFDGDAGNSLSINYDAQFSTYDRDNDNDDSSNCAEKRMSGWWFDDCKHSSLNGLYNSTDFGTGINWIGWHDYRYSLQYVHIAIRPVSTDLMKKIPMIIKPVWY